MSANEIQPLKEGADLGDFAYKREPGGLRWGFAFSCGVPATLDAGRVGWASVSDAAPKEAVPSVSVISRAWWLYKWKAANQDVIWRKRRKSQT